MPRKPDPSREVVAVDFETYFATPKKAEKLGIAPCSVSELGIMAYRAHPEFEAYLVAIVGPSIRYVGHPDEFDWSKLNGKHLIAHNAGFDQPIGDSFLAKVGAKATWDCTADLAAFHGYPRSLSGAMKELFGQFVSKQVRNDMDGVRWETLPDFKKAEVIRYADSDSVNCLRIWEKLSPTWPEHEREISRLNRLMGHTGLAVDWDLACRNHQILQARLDELEKEIPWVGGLNEDGEEIKIGSRKAFNDACVALGIEPPTTRSKKAESWIEWLEVNGPKAPFARAMSEWTSVNRIAKTYETLFNRSLGDRIAYDSLYFGAHTGRNSGAGNLNMFNMPRGEIAGTDLRNVFIARAGNTLVGADLSQIEPRCYRPETLVLTATGYKMIKDLTQIDKVWDGVEFVDHDGVIFKQGVAHAFVNGSFSTDDHAIFISESESELASAVCPRAAWAFRAAGWADLWKLACAVLPGIWRAYCFLPLRLWARKAGKSFRSALRALARMHVLRENRDVRPKTSGTVRETPQ